jgi:hypothetical protein
MTYVVVDIAHCLASWKSWAPKLHRKHASRKECFLAGYEAAWNDLQNGPDQPLHLDRWDVKVGLSD